MTWIFIALLAHIFWGLVNIGDKYLITNKIKSPYVYLVLLTWSGILAVILIPFIDFYIPELKWLLWIALASALYFFGGLPYVKAVKIEDISRINIWWNLIPLFTLLLSWWTIGDHLSNHQFVAFVVLLFGSILASIHFRQKNITLSKAFPYMMIATLCYAGYAVVIRYVTQSVPFLVTYVSNGIIIVFISFSMFLWPRFRTEFTTDLKNINKKIAATFLSIAVLDEAAVLLNIWALSLGPAALIFALEGVQTLFVFLLAVLISLFRPQIIKEELDKRNIVLKLTALVIIIVGVILVNLW